MNISLIIQIIVLVLELISKGLSEAEAVSYVGNLFGVSKDLIRRWM